MTNVVSSTFTATALLACLSGCATMTQTASSRMDGIVLPSPAPLPLRSEVDRTRAGDGSPLGVERKYSSRTGNVTLLRQFGNLPHDVPAQRAVLDGVGTRGFIEAMRRDVAWETIGGVKTVSPDCYETKLIGRTSGGEVTRAIKRTYFGSDTYYVIGHFRAEAEYQAIERWIRAVRLE